MNNVPFFKPSFSQEEVKQIKKVLNSGWVTAAQVTKNFEEEVKNILKVKNAVAVSSCTAALHLSLLALGIKPPDEVITSTLTFCATANAIEYTGAKTVFADIDSKTLNISVNDLEKKITKKTKAIICVHIAGIPCEMDKIKAIAKKYKLFLIEDAAHAIGSKYKNKFCGNLGDVGCFSFYANKTITTGEGGIAVTNNKSVADKIKLLSLHGLTHNAWNRYNIKGSWNYDMESLGYKYNFNDILAAIGIVQLSKLFSFIEKKEKIAKYYLDNLKNIEEIELPSLQGKDFKNSYHLFIIKLNLKKLKINRDNFITLLKEKGVGVGVHFKPVHLLKYYQKKYNYNKDAFPEAAAVYERIISLPLFSQMSKAQIQKVIKSIKEIIYQNKT